MVNIIKIADQRRSRTASLFIVNKGGLILLCLSKENVTFGYNYDKDDVSCFGCGNLIELFLQINRYYKKTDLRKCNFSFPILSSIKNRKFDLNRICSVFFLKEGEQNLRGDYYE